MNNIKLITAKKPDSSHLVVVRITVMLKGESKLPAD